ncbi:Insulinase (Peptidase M16) [Agyrium rufum]|nr:Insulinase (Peptidase M16) [Agyrium rufum]
MANMNSIPIERLTDKLEAPELDDRSYRVIRLPNQLEALLVHDPDTDKASASVNVEVGSFSDAEDMPGMAHAVEHLLFMGTKKYPKENEYSQYLSSHSGYSNAYTASTQTNYFFEVAASAEEDVPSNKTPESPLYGALDRFAQFFVAPLFLSETLDRELRAVDSENKKNLQSDTWRLNQLNKSLSNPNYPYQHFSTGNLQTLRDEPRKRGVEIRKEFIQFHEKHYSANRMKLVVLGKEPLDTLQEWVADLFKDVRNKDLPPNRWDGMQPYTKKELLTQVFAKPVMDSRTLDISFPYQDEESLYKTHPSRYISHLIGHEGPGSILAYIKAKGWANGLSAGDSPVGPGTAFFTISVRLTPEGLKQYEEIVQIVFQYIALLKDAPPQKWIVDEVKGMAEVDFRFKQKTPASSFTSVLSSEMQKCLPRDWLMSGSRLIRQFDADAITHALNFLRTDAYRLTIVSKEFPGDWDQKERWYGTEYRVEKIPKEFEEAVHKAGTVSRGKIPKELHLPHRNEFVPTRLTVEKKEVAEPAKSPLIIRNDASFRTWWKKDDQFWVPKASVSLMIRNPLVGCTGRNSVKSLMYCHLVKDALEEYSYDAEIAGLDYSLGANSLGLSVDFSGYNDKMPVLMEKVLLCMRDLEIKADRFEIIKERITRDVKNWHFHQPYRQVGEFSRKLTVEKGWTKEDYEAELPNLTPQDISEMAPQLLKQIHVESLMHGNLYKEDALRMTDLIESILKPLPLSSSQWQFRRNLIMAEGTDFTYPREHRDPENVNNCIEYYLHVGPYSDQALRARLLLFSQLTDEQGFDQLRTKEQLGYIVWTGTKIMETIMGYRVIIQSERASTYLETRINAFLATVGTTLKNMPDADFEAHKKSIIAKRLEKLKNLDQEGNRLWNHITSEYYNFHQVDADVAGIRPLTKADILTFYERFISPTSEVRAKMSVHVNAQTSPKDIAAKMTPAEQRLKVQELVGQYITQIGLTPNEDVLAKCFASMDLTSDDTGEAKISPIDTITNALSRYMEDDPAASEALKENEDKEAQLMEQTKVLLSSFLPTIGIVIKKAGIGEEERVGEDKDLPKAPKVKETVFVDDVHAFKAKLLIGPAAVPVEDLTRFEEVESKL